MKLVRTLVLGALPLIATAGLQAQQAKGDVEVGFFGMYLNASVDGGDPFKMGMVNATFGVFITDRFELAIGPTISIMDTGGTSSTNSGASLNGSYCFLTPGAKAVPYVGATYYYLKPQDADAVNMYGVNAGLKYFFTPKAAVNFGLNYLTGKIEDVNVKTTTLMVGMSYLF